ncbi:Cgr1 family-domain-containing protein [Trametes maxima]|nr:Cgr1 family-domain-containing protein [Trametes maxima]
MSEAADSFIALSGESSATKIDAPPTDASARPLAPTSAGRVSGKAWKVPKSATVRSHLPTGVKTTKWEERMEKTKKEQAIKKLQAELKQEKADEIKRRKEVTLERKKAAEERQRLEEAKAKMGARKAARLRRKMGHTKKINH